VHGDYHLGQVLWVENDFVILDFEGEPTRSVEERRAKQSPLKDVAGMLRSFHYAAYAGLFAFTQGRPGDFGRLERWADLWHRRTSAVFLRAYGETVKGAGFLPARPEEFAALLEAFLLAKAFYELAYELNNRPDWVRIPLRGVLELLGEGGRTGGPLRGGEQP
jgi:maltose alpha-D-glucosyltransferase/alpha-amylase